MLLTLVTQQCECLCSAVELHFSDCLRECAAAAMPLTPADCLHAWCRPTTAPLIDLAALAARMRQQADARSLGQAAAVAAATTGKAASSARTVCQQHRAMLGLGDHLRQALAR